MKYRVYVTERRYGQVDIEAESKQEAEDKAYHQLDWATVHVFEPSGEVDEVVEIDESGKEVQ